MRQPAIPTVDLTPFFTAGDEAGRKRAKDTIAEACADYGFFQIVNHGVPLDLMNQAPELSKTFFNYSDRVVRLKGRSRHSYVYFHSLRGDKWVEPLPEFTREIGVEAKYRGFYYKDYQALRMRNKSHPPSNPEDIIKITHYEI